ncbi:MAG TPA: methyltransferase domain-containing protein [Allosphingosinicella sp.]|nr:methyltransferase domain-containing protein [Allosphingosinicella sp.]
MSSPVDQRHIDRNIRIHDQVASSYEKTHDEIFNPLEQARLRAALERAKAGMRSAVGSPRALDFGCGSGNLTRHLLALGFEVVAADVSPGFLRLIEERHPAEPVTTYRMDGRSLSGLGDSSFDFVAAYSVLHHVPDYLAAVEEMGRVTRPGGIVYIDHEHSPSYWRGDPAYREFRRGAARFDWRKFLVPHNYYGKLRRLLVDPHYSNEGDIHVWPDDHIEWDEIDRRLGSAGFETLFSEDYLVFRSGYRAEVYEAYRNRCADMRVTAMRRGA